MENLADAKIEVLKSILSLFVCFGPVVAVVAWLNVNTMKGVWSLLRSWLRPHRGVSQQNLPLYLTYFELTHNLRQRGKALFESLIAMLVKPLTWNRK